MGQAYFGSLDPTKATPRASRKSPLVASPSRPHCHGPEPTSSAVSPSGCGCGGAVRWSTRSGASASLRGAGLASRRGQPLIPCAASLKRRVSHVSDAGLQTGGRASWSEG